MCSSDLWNGTDITNLSVTDRAKAGVSYGFQQPPRFKGLKVKDLIALLPALFLVPVAGKKRD